MGPWNIGHDDLQFMTHKSKSQGQLISDQLVVFKTEKKNHFFNSVLDFDLQPHLGQGPWGKESWNESRPSRVAMVQIWMLSD